MVNSVGDIPSGRRVSVVRQSNKRAREGRGGPQLWSLILCSRFLLPQGFQMSFCPEGTKLPISCKCLLPSLFHSCTLGNKIECQARWEDMKSTPNEHPNVFPGYWFYTGFTFDDTLLYSVNEPGKSIPGLIHSPRICASPRLEHPADDQN